MLSVDKKVIFLSIFHLMYQDNHYFLNAKGQPSTSWFIQQKLKKGVHDVTLVGFLIFDYYYYYYDYYLFLIWGLCLYFELYFNAVILEEYYFYRAKKKKREYTILFPKIMFT